MSELWSEPIGCGKYTRARAIMNIHARYNAGQIRPPLSRPLRAHARACPPCSEEVRKLRASMRQYMVERMEQNIALLRKQIADSRRASFRVVRE